ncbi:hypothetical protein RvY_08410-2 [Ramazzottius varieornatus]|uniref:Uncharacterized protein n=1 Tax=Ramazzottius varieornatus TaxID=947166 RepID=A0A1D1V817_RAMVA|nr:hypothetical protein RvY_08410-2 [Ramazzottius varieornatus]
MLPTGVQAAEVVEVEVGHEGENLRSARTLKIGSDSTDEEADTDSFINDGPDLLRAKTPARSPSRSPSRNNDFTYTKMPRRKGEIVFVKWRHENMYYFYSAATIIKKVPDDTYVVRWIIPWKDTPTIEEENILRVADVIRVGQRAIYMPGWDDIYEDEGTIYEVKGQGSKITVHMDVLKKNRHVAKKLFDVPLTELSFFADYMSRPSTSRRNENFVKPHIYAYFLDSLFVPYTLPISTVCIHAQMSPVLSRFISSYRHSVFKFILAYS